MLMIIELYLAPFGAYWNIKFDLTRLLAHVLLVYQDQLDLMSSDHVNYNLYLIYFYYVVIYISYIETNIFFKKKFILYLDVIR